MTSFSHLRKTQARILAAMLASAPLVCISLPAQQPESIQTALINPRALAVNQSTHTLYAVDQPRNRVMVYDSVTGSTSSISVGKAPDALAVDPLANRIYVANTGSNNVSVIDGATRTVIATVPAGRIPYAIQVDPGLHKALVTNTYSNFVTEIDGASSQGHFTAAGREGCRCDRHAAPPDVSAGL